MIRFLFIGVWAGGRGLCWKYSDVIESGAPGCLFRFCLALPEAKTPWGSQNRCQIYIRFQSNRNSKTQHVSVIDSNTLGGLNHIGSWVERGGRGRSEQDSDFLLFYRFLLFFLIKKTQDFVANKNAGQKLKQHKPRLTRLLNNPKCLGGLLPQPAVPVLLFSTNWRGQIDLSLELKTVG